MMQVFQAVVSSLIHCIDVATHNKSIGVAPMRVKHLAPKGGIARAYDTN